MKYCPNLECPHRVDVGKAAEFLDEVEACSDCGARLEWRIESEAPIPGPGAEAAITWVDVGVFSDRYQAQFAKGRLEAEGIEAVFLNEHNANTEFSNYWGNGQIKLAVKEADVATARELLRCDYSGMAPEDVPGPKENS